MNTMTLTKRDTKFGTDVPMLTELGIQSYISQGIVRLNIEGGHFILRWQMGQKNF